MEQEMQQLSGQLNDEGVEVNHQEPLEVMSRLGLEGSEPASVSDACSTT